MTNKNQDTENRLGHDPLEWLEDVQEESTESQSDTVDSASPASASSDSVEKPNENTNTDDSVQVEVSQKTPSQEASIQEEPTQEIPEEPVAETSSSDIPNFILEEGIGRFILPERLMVQIAEEFHKNLCDIAQISSLKELHISAVDVLDIDTAGLQLLYALTQQLSSSGCQVIIEGVPENLDKIFTVAGLENYFRAFTHAA